MSEGSISFGILLPSVLLREAAAMDDARNMPGLVPPCQNKTALEHIECIKKTSETVLNVYKNYHEYAEKWSNTAGAVCSQDSLENAEELINDLREAMHVFEDSARKLDTWKQRCVKSDKKHKNWHFEFSKFEFFAETKLRRQ